MYSRYPSRYCPTPRTASYTPRNKGLPVQPHFTKLDCNQINDRWGVALTLRYHVEGILHGDESKISNKDVLSHWGLWDHHHRGFDVHVQGHPGAPACQFLHTSCSHSCGLNSCLGQCLFCCLKIIYKSLSR